KSERLGSIERLTNKEKFQITIELRQEFKKLFSIKLILEKIKLKKSTFYEILKSQNKPDKDENLKKLIFDLFNYNK
ncbi:hypothetical protein CP02DC14_1326, partial [Chlamydia psittaci 02DC14]